MRVPIPIVILKVLAWLAYPALLALVKVARYVDNLHG
jgi:hypothetical protein